MTEEHRDAYTDLLELIEGAGYQVIAEEFDSEEMQPYFDADLRLIPPRERRE